MPIVLDSSIAMALAMEDEQLPDEEAFVDRLSLERAVVPHHWEYEVANSLVSASRRGRQPSTQCRTRFELLKALPINIDERAIDVASNRTLEFALEHGLTVYDAAYLELAVRRSLPLATLDKALARAARAEGIEVIGG